jgi:hypothetical protein
MSHHLPPPLTLNQPLIKVENGLILPFSSTCHKPISGRKNKGIRPKSNRYEPKNENNFGKTDSQLWESFEPFGKRRKEFVPPRRDEGRQAERAGASESISRG